MSQLEYMGMSTTNPEGETHVDRGERIRYIMITLDNESANAKGGIELLFLNYLTEDYGQSLK